MTYTALAFIISIAQYRIGDVFELTPFNVMNAFLANFCVCLFSFLTPIEFVRPGFLNWKRVGLLLTPFTLWCGLCLLIIPEESLVPKYTSFQEAIVYWYKFDVWGIIVIYLMPYAYMFGMFRNFKKTYPIYVSYIEMNYPSLDKESRRWLKSASYTPVLTLLVFNALVILQDPLTTLIYTVVVTSVFLIITIRSLHFASLQDQFAHLDQDTDYASFVSLQEDKAKAELEILKIEAEVAEADANNRAYIYEFIEQFNAWFEADKPYLDPKFQQSDVMKKFGISRSKASYLINNGLNCSFSEYVVKKRLETACELLKQHQEVPINEISIRSGFYSHSNFSRTFHRYTGMTPNEYRNS